MIAMRFLPKLIPILIPVAIGILVAIGVRCLSQQSDSAVRADSATSQQDYETLLGAAEIRMNDPATAPAAREEEVRTAIDGSLFYRRAIQYEHALSLLLRAREHVPQSEELLLDLALLEDEMKLYVDADASVQAAIKLSPEDPRAMYAEARIKMDLQRVPEAETAMIAYLKMRPNDASAHYGLGRMYRSELRNEEAAHEFSQSLELQPHQAESNYQLGELALESRDTKTAEASYDRALAVDPNHAGALTGKGILAFRQRDYAAADAFLQAAERSAPAFDTAHYFRGQVLARLGRKQESDSEFAVAFKLDAEKTKFKGMRLAGHP